jgi:phosphoenolpyruvate-protein kinase (PTS system EI component)
MKRTTAYLLGLMIAGVLVSVGIASAFGGGFASEEQRLAIKKAIEENNFEAWKTAMTEALTQENFNKLVERNKAMTERKELQDAVKQAIANGDYNAYKQAFENLKGSMQVMSEDDFNAMVERYKAGELVGGFGFPRGGFGGHHMPW